MLNRTGIYCILFHPDRLVTGKEDAANNYSHGYYTVGRDMVDQTLESIRKLVCVCVCVCSLRLLIDLPV